MKLTVVHLEGSKQGLTETLVGDVITIGRDPSNSLSFDPFKDLDVSTRHASLTVQGGQVVLQDLGSTNGTFLNGSKISAAMPIPANGCMVQFGDKGPKVQLTWTLETGPGKKTVMIQDLRRELDSAGAEAKQAKARGIKTAGCLVVLGLLIAGVAWILSSMSAKKELEKQVTTLAGDADQQKGLAEGLLAGETEGSKEDFQKAVAALDEAKKAQEAGDLATAKEKFTEAAKLFDLSGKKAGQASQKKLLAMQTQLEKSAAADAEARKKKQAEEAALVAKLKAELKAEQDKKLKDLENKLKAARDTAGLSAELGRLKGSKNPDELKQGIAAAEAALKDLDPNAPEAKQLAAQLADMKKGLDEVKDLTPDTLKEIAKKARPKILAIRSRVFGVPKGQTLKTTKLRYPVAETLGTGFFVSAEGHVMTAKEVISPELFDPKALARHQKLAEKGMSFHRELEVLRFDPEQKKYVKVGEGAVTVAREFPESLGATTKVTIEFDNQTMEVEVKPHQRDDADLVVLKVEGAKGPFEFLPLAPKAADAGLPVINLGVQVEGKEDLALFMFDGRVKGAGKVIELAAPSFGSWLGGPVLDAGGQVVGVLVENGVAISKAVGVGTIRPVVEKK
ncbi:MAG: FHA domain-containing protein [Planctomycetota bacterium]